MTRSMNKSIVIAIVTACLMSASATAATVHVKITGTVEWNLFTTGPLAVVDDGDAVVTEFDVDSNVFVNSPSFPTRGYTMNPANFTMTLGAASVGLSNSQTSYFVIRNNDPAVDGFFISTNIDLPLKVPMTVPNVRMDFLRTFNIGTVWPSLNILDALGSYGFENMSSFNWTFDVGASQPLGILYETITLTEVEQCPADVTGDGTVNIQDLLFVVAHWNEGAGSPADVNGDNTVNILDLLAVVGAWGACAG